jgi:hypothetical protein
MKPLFLLGIMRSGTTYFRNVLASNRSILSLGSELSGFWTGAGRAPAGLVGRCPYLDGSTLEEKVRREVRRYFERRGWERNSPWMISYRLYRKYRFGNETVLKTFRHPYLLNKSTHLHNKIGYIDRIFPEARFIFILRDLPSNANSLLMHLNNIEKRQGFTASLPENSFDCWEFHPTGRFGGRRFTFEDILRYWLNHNSLALRDLSRLDRGRVALVRYEDIAGGLEGVLSRLEEFLGIKLNRNVDSRIINNTAVDPLHSWEADLGPEQLESLGNFLEENRGDYATITGMMDRGVITA